MRRSPRDAIDATTSLDRPRFWGDRAVVGERSRVNGAEPSVSASTLQSTVGMSTSIVARPESFLSLAAADHSGVRRVRKEELARVWPLRRTLVVTDAMDAPDNLAKELVGKLRCAVEMVDSLEAGLASLETHTPDAVLVVSATFESCLATLRALRASSNGGAFTIVVLLAHHADRDWQALRDAGADASYHQPTPTPEIARAILGVTLSQRATRAW
jgi:CheY-like chemotaxis protein